MKLEDTYSLIEKGEISIDLALKNLSHGENLYDVTEKENLSIQAITNSLAKLNSLVGLKNIKQLLYEHLAFIRIQQIRKARELPTIDTSMHMAFLGNPGTGKTTVARIIGEIFNELKLLSKGHLVEIDRSDLVGEYIGHTAQKTKKTIQKALGGVLFIDEAYSLCRADERDFGQEAIDILVKEIEDKRHNMVLIVAGYIPEMKKFLKSNPGLSSRIPLHLLFPDYNLNQLMDIANLFLQKNQYRLGYEAREKLRCLIMDNLIKGDNSNGRMVRNILERSFRRQATRILLKTSLTRHDLLELNAHDFSEDENICCAY